MLVFETPVICAAILSFVPVHPSQKILTHDVTGYLALVFTQDVTKPSGENERWLLFHP